MFQGVPAVDDQLVEGQRLLGDGQVDHRSQLLGLEREKILNFCFNTHNNQITLTAHFTLYQFWRKFADLHSTFWRLEKLHREKPSLKADFYILCWRIVKRKLVQGGGEAAGLLYKLFQNACFFIRKP